MLTVANYVRAGVEVPDTTMIDRAIEYARRKCEPYLFSITSCAPGFSQSGSVN